MENKIIIDNILYEKVDNFIENDICYIASDIVDINNKSLIKFNNILNYNNKEYKLYSIKYNVFKQCFDYDISFEVDDYLYALINKKNYLTKQYFIINTHHKSYNILWIDKKEKYIKFDSDIDEIYIENENIKSYLKLLYKNKLIIYTDNKWKILN